MRWDLFCRVVDNYGDVGVCWRLAADLGARGQSVRLWIDDGAALAWMAPQGAPGVEVRRWEEAEAETDVHDVVVEAFGCDPPARFVERMAAMAAPPAWINLEYLSAEDYVQRSHGLPSPQSTGPGRGLTKWFFYPGFGAATGGLIREPGLDAAMRSFDRAAWLRRHAIEPATGERVVTVFCYPQAPLQSLVDALARPGQPPALLLLTPGAAQSAASRIHLPPAVRCHALPWLDQPGFDRLLWSSDLNLVRGEDSLVRAIWAGRPFLWQLYPQHDGAHAAKLDAFLASSGAFAVPGLADLQRAWNGLRPGPLAWPDAAAWSAACGRFHDEQRALGDLTGRLLDFVHDPRRRPAGQRADRAC